MGSLRAPHFHTLTHARAGNEKPAQAAVRVIVATLEVLQMEPICPKSHPSFAG